MTLRSKTATRVTGTKLVTLVNHTERGDTMAHVTRTIMNRAARLRYIEQTLRAEPETTPQQFAKACGVSVVSIKADMAILLDVAERKRGNWLLVGLHQPQDGQRVMVFDEIDQRPTFARYHVGDLVNSFTEIYTNRPIKAQYWQPEPPAPQGTPKR